MNYARILRTLVAALILALLVATIPAIPALAAESLFVSPIKGKIGDSVEVYGSGFDDSAVDYGVYFSDERAFVGGDIGTDVINYELLGIVTTETDGTFEGFFFAVPGELRDGTVVEKVRGDTYYVYVTYRNDDRIRAWVRFTVESVPKITLSSSQGAVGVEVKVTGSGFALSKSITIKFDNTQVKTTVTDSSGSFADVPFTIPESYRGNHTVKAEDTSNNSATATFATSQSISVTPTSGASGDTVTISGSGFAASKSVTISFDEEEVATTETNSVGSFSDVTFAVLARGVGNYNVKVLDGSGNSASVEFTLATSTFSINPTSGYAGTEVTVNGGGFQASSPVTITFNGATVVTVNSDAGGSFTTSFDIPSLAADTYQVKASDGTNAAETAFSITTSVSISPVTSAAVPGHVGTELTINGIGFTPGGMATVTYDDAQITTAAVGADGTFLASFKVPAGSGGAYSIVVTDGVNTEQFAFVMESTPPPSPRPLKPEMDIKVEAETYFDWEDIEDPSGVTYTLQIATDEDFPADSIVLEETGLIPSEYTITKEDKLESVSKNAPYYWHVKAVDGASNESEWSGTGSFHAGFTFRMSQGLIYTLFGLAVLLFGIFGFWMGRKTAYY